MHFSGDNHLTMCGLCTCVAKRVLGNTTTDRTKVTCRACLKRFRVIEADMARMRKARERELRMQQFNERRSHRPWHRALTAS